MKIEPPPYFGNLDEWQAYLAALEAMPQSPEREAYMEVARNEIAYKTGEGPSSDFVDRMTGDDGMRVVKPPRRAI